MKKMKNQLVFRYCQPKTRLELATSVYRDVSVF